MKPRKLRVKNIGPFVDEVIDFTTISGSLVAVAGLNGAGKTMFLESIFAGMFRNFPSRPAGIYRYCNDRHAGIEFEFEVGGKIYTSYLNLDSKSRKMEAILAYDKSPLNDGLTGTFDVAIKSILGDEGQALASAYGAQNKKGNFVELEKSKRKDLFITMIGAAMLDLISNAAKSDGDALNPEKENLSGQLAVLKETAEKVIPETAGIQEFIDRDTVQLATIQEQIDEFIHDGTPGRWSSPGRAQDTQQSCHPVLRVFLKTHSSRPRLSPAGPSFRCRDKKAYLLKKGPRPAINTGRPAYGPACGSP